MYDFNRQVEKQREYYEAFKTWLSSYTDIVECQDASFSEDMSGVDMLVKTCDDKVYKMQVKTDFQSERTGNIVVEIVSQARFDGRAKLGWVFHLHSVDYLAYITVPSGMVRIYESHAFFDFVMDQYRELPNFSVENPDYLTLGILIPVRKIASLSCRKSLLDDARVGLERISIERVGL